MVERFRWCEPGEIGLVNPDQVPVAPICRRRSDRTTETTEPHPVCHGDPGRHHHQHDEEGGQQPPATTNPEVRQVKATRGGPPAQQQVGDEVTAEGKEHAHAEQTAWRPAELLVERDDREYRDGPEPVESGHVALVRADWPRHELPPACSRTRLGEVPRASSLLRKVTGKIPSIA